MKRTVFIAGCAIAVATGVYAAPQVASEPFVMGFNEFQAVGDIAGWIVTDQDQLSRRGRGADDAPGDDHGVHGPGHTMNAPEAAPLMQMARRGADDPAGDDNNGRGGSGGGQGADDNSTDDNGSGSGRKKPRVPGGSGCDGAGDVQEHAACRG